MNLNWLDDEMVPYEWTWIDLIATALMVEKKYGITIPLLDELQEEVGE